MNEDKLNKLIEVWENEVIEFKEANNDYSTDKIGRYFSALSNESNIRGYEQGWLIFGINNKSRTVVGSDYRKNTERLQSLKNQIAENTEPSITIRNIHELNTKKGRVVIFEIPMAPRGMPISWKGHYYARAGESLTSLGLDKLDEIRLQTTAIDWSAQIVQNATIEHLDSKAIERARTSFARKYANRFSENEVKKWSVSTFLDRTRLTRDGKITKATILLLGKRESAHLLLPYPAQMTWKLEGAERAYEHFYPPFFLNSTALYQKIRNFQIRILPNNELLPIEVAKYDDKIVLESLHNCIAHQDYTENARIIVTELQDKLILENKGNFFEGVPEDYMLGNKTPSRYRNPFLAQAMTELNMIDTMGYGIHEMHLRQAKRYLPLSDYDLSELDGVKTTIHGAIVDSQYSQLLMQKTDLLLSDIIVLDMIQKKIPIESHIINKLRKAKLVEGRKSNLHISATIAKVTSKEADYIKTKVQDDTFYIKLIIDYIKTFKVASRADINNLLWNKLSDGLNDEQKKYKIANLLTLLRRQGKIKNTGTRNNSKWVC